LGFVSGFGFRISDFINKGPGEFTPILKNYMGTPPTQIYFTQQ
jgi:hypothetical protein